MSTGVKAKRWNAKLVSHSSTEDSSTIGLQASPIYCWLMCNSYMTICYKTNSFHINENVDITEIQISLHFIVMSMQHTCLNKSDEA